MEFGVRSSKNFVSHHFEKGYIYISLIIYGYIASKGKTIFGILAIIAFLIINLFWIFWFLCRVDKLIHFYSLISKRFLYTRRANFVFLSFYNSIFSVFPILLLTPVLLEKYQQDINSFILVMLSITFIVITSNIFIINKPNNINSIYWYLILGSITLVIITIFTGQISLFSKKIMSIYKLGNIKPAAVIIDKQDCIHINKLLKFHRVKKEAKNDNEKETKDDENYFSIENDSCIIPNMNILSRIGKESYVEIYNLKAKRENGKKEQINIRFPIPSSSIKKWNLINRRLQ